MLSNWIQDYVDGDLCFKMFDEWVALVTLTFREGLRLDCVQEGLDQGWHETHAGVLLCALVLGLGEAQRCDGCRTGSLSRDGLGQAQPQEHHSNNGSERSAAAPPPPPTSHTLTQRHVYRWDSAGRQKTGSQKRSPHGTSSVFWYNWKQGKKKKKNTMRHSQEAGELQTAEGNPQTESQRKRSRRRSFQNGNGKNKTASHKERNNGSKWEM